MKSFQIRKAPIPGHHVIQPTHDGFLSSLCITCGLVDPATIVHTHSPPPPTNIRDKNRLNYILVSNSIIPAVESNGNLAFCLTRSLILEDHQPCIIDFSAVKLFQEQSFVLAPFTQWGLQLIDPQKEEKYLASLNKLLDNQHSP